MTYKQLKQFNQATAGTTHGMCLQNVRLGFQIPPRYNSAWEAWAGTEQHPDRNIPTGVDVPLFYDFTDSAGNRYGHINVRLANGQVWNDGRVFPDLPSFEKFWSNVKYVGWGESVNKVKVIEGVQMAVIQNAPNWFGRCNKTMQRIRGRDLGKTEFEKYAVGAEFLSWVEAVEDNAEADNYYSLGQWAKANKTAIEKQVADLSKQVTDLSTRPTKAELDAVKANAAQLQTNLDEANAKNDELIKSQTEDTVLLDQAGNWLTKLFNRLFKKGQ